MSHEIPPEQRIDHERGVGVHQSPVTWELVQEAIRTKRPVVVQDIDAHLKRKELANRKKRGGFFSRIRRWVGF